MKESERISDILKYIRNLQSQYNFTKNRIDDLQALQEDLLHKLEFIAGTAKERNKIATALRKCRVERRQSKEYVELFRELNEFINQNQDKIKRLEKILGNMRKIEENQNKRSYKPRILSLTEYEGGDLNANEGAKGKNKLSQPV